MARDGISCLRLKDSGALTDTSAITSKLWITVVAIVAYAAYIYFR
jgi:hypothetical protein